MSSFSKKIDGKKLSSLILPNKDLLIPYYKKYVQNGVINADAIYDNFSKFNFSSNESYSDDESNNPILRFLYKFFVKWPKSFISGIWELFKETVIDEWRFSKTSSIIAGMLWLIVGIFAFLLGSITYSLIENEINGLKSGKVTEESFKSGHYEVHLHTIIVGKSKRVYTTTDWVPDSWYVEVVGENGRKEVWYTHNDKVGKTTKVGQEVVNDDDWTWTGTETER
jgi:hypothetical protein